MLRSNEVLAYTEFEICIAWYSIDIETHDFTRKQHPKRQRYSLNLTSFND